MAPKYVKGEFLCGANFLPNKYAEANISANSDAFIRNVNIWLIFDHNSPDYYGIKRPYADALGARCCYLCGAVLHFQK